jgi:hypothetical protein
MTLTIFKITALVMLAFGSHRGLCAEGWAGLERMGRREEEGREARQDQRVARAVKTSPMLFLPSTIHRPHRFCALCFTLMAVLLSAR